MQKLKKIMFCYFITVLVFLGLVFTGDKAITVISEKSPVVREHCIVIDAGHGGVDGGAMSCSGQLESTYNLQIAHCLNDLLNLLGHDTLMIRSTDISVYKTGKTIAQKKVSDLKERVRIVNETPNSILLSIHQNYFSDSRYYGAQVFYADNEDSMHLADNFQRQLVTYLNPGSNRHIKKSSGIYLMEHIERPGVLIECGFLSNPEEEAKLRSNIYQKKICCVIAATLSQYLSNS